jgi:hypothetical protein
VIPGSNRSPCSSGGNWVFHLTQVEPGVKISSSAEEEASKLQWHIWAHKSGKRGRTGSVCVNDPGTKRWIANLPKGFRSHFLIRRSSVRARRDPPHVCAGQCPAKPPATGPRRASERPPATSPTRLSRGDAQALRDGVQVIGEQSSVDVQCHGRGGVAEHPLDDLDIGHTGSQQCSYPVE